MNNKFWIILFSIFFSLARANGSEVHNFTIADNKGSFETRYYQGDILSKLVWNDKVIKEHHKSAASETLRSFETYQHNGKLFIIISFQKGVHGEAFEVWSFPEAKELFQFNSVWPIQVSSKANSETHFEITYYTYSQKGPEGEKLIWTP